MTDVVPPPPVPPSERAWYRRGWGIALIVLGALFLAPLLLVVPLAVFGFLVGIESEAPTPAPPVEESPSPRPEPTASLPPRPTSTAPPSPSPAQESASSEPDVTAAEQDRIRALVELHFGGSTGDGRERIAELDLVEQFYGGWGVFIEYHASMSGPVPVRKARIENQMIEFYRDLYTADFDVNQATVLALLPTGDPPKPAPVYKTMLDATDAAEVDWERYERLDFSMIWTTSILHPQFRDD